MAGDCFATLAMTKAVCVTARHPYITGMTSPTDPRRFLYRADALDPDLAQKLAREALAKADDGELYLQYRATESFGFEDGRLKTADYSTDAGFALRAVTGEMTGFAHASDVSAGAIRRAAETLALLDPAKQAPAGPPPGPADVPVPPPA